MPMKRNERWARYAYLGTLTFPIATLSRISADREMSKEAREKAVKLYDDIIALRALIGRDLKAMDTRNKADAQSK
jgi:hypothetical protein